MSVRDGGFREDDGDSDCGVAEDPLLSRIRVKPSVSQRERARA